MNNHGPIKFTTRTKQTDGWGRTESIYVCNYVQDPENTFLGKPMNKLVSAYTVYKNLKPIN